MPRKRRKNLAHRHERRALSRARRSARRKRRVKRLFARLRHQQAKRRRWAKRLERRMKLKFHDSVTRHRESFLPMPSVPEVGRYYLWNKNTGAISGLQIFRSTDIVPSGKLGALQKKVCFDRVHPGPPYRKGGPFSLYVASNPLYQVMGSGKHVGRINNSTEAVYTGGHIPTSFGPTAPSQSDWEQFGYGGRFSGSYGEVSDADAATAYNRARPKIEHADAAVFAGEFREVPDQFRGTARYFQDIWKKMKGDLRSPVMQPKHIADEFLNHQFGWAPFIGDLLKFWDTFQNSEKYISQITQDNGEWIRRRRRIGLPTSEVTHSSRNYTPQCYPGPQGYTSEFRTVDGNSTRGFTDFEARLKKTAWFEGSFKYYLPQFDAGHPESRSRYFEVMRYVSIYGARVSPSTVWNLLPYSWLADWVSNAGDVIDNFTASIFDNLASRYAFVMQTTIEEYHNKTVIFNKDGSTSNGHWVATVTRKTRKYASPFGFGLSSADFTPRQIAILLSLGISRAN